MTDETEVRELAETLYERDTGRRLDQAAPRDREEYREYALSILRVSDIWETDNG